MAYLAHENPEALTRADYVRLAFCTASGARDTLPFSSRFLQRFETEYCYDRYFEGALREGWCDTRIMCCGHAFVVVGPERSPFFTDPERGLLGQFRHQYFVVGLLAWISTERNLDNTASPQASIWAAIRAYSVIPYGALIDRSARTHPTIRRNAAHLGRFAPRGRKWLRHRYFS